MKTLARALSVTLLAFTLIAPSALADALSDGHSAEKAGKLLEALEHYTAALQQTREGSEDEYKLQERIIKLVRNLNPPPAVPEDAYRHMARGEAFLEGATNKEGFKRAAKEFHTAARLAPWLPDVYRTLGIVQDKAELYAKAIDTLKLYLLAAPMAPDAREVHNYIYKIEVRLEEARKQTAQKAEEELRRVQTEAVLSKLERLFGGASYDNVPCISRWEPMPNGLGKQGVGCNYNEYFGKYWSRHKKYDTSFYEFSFPGDGTVILRFVPPNGSYATHNISLRGTPKGPGLEDILWESPQMKSNGTDSTIVGWKTAWVEINEKRRDFVVSRDRPNLDWNDPRFDKNARYGYTWYIRE